MYYSQFHYKFNHIKYFWYNSKFYTYKNCTYIIEKPRKIILVVLKYVKHSTILEHYKNYIEKIDRYRKKVKYESLQWKKLTSHQKP